MGVLSKIGTFLGGGAAKAGLGVANDIANIVERWRPGDAKNHEMVMEVSELVESSYADARKHDQPMSSGVPIVDAIVNGINRLIRPWVTITVIGSLFGYWDLPPPDQIDPQYWVLGKIIIGFWFGGRALFKDLPALVQHIRK
jgi:hypothetical protein